MYQLLSAKLKMNFDDEHFFEIEIKHDDDEKYIIDFSQNYSYF